MSYLNPETAQQIRTEIAAATHILLHFHPTPDGDCVGSALALAHLLRSWGKSVTVISGDTPLPASLRHLPGANTVEAHSYPVVMAQPERHFDLFIMVDTPSLQAITRQSFTFPADLRTVLIDHHVTNTGFADINWIDARYPAACQMVYELLAHWQVTFTPEIAECLLVGLFTDTGGFQYPPTSAATFSAAAALVPLVPHFARSLFLVNNSYQPEHIYYQTLALENVQLCHEGRVAISVVSAAALASRGLRVEHADKSSIANLLKSVVGWEVGVGLVEIEPGICKASLRVRDAQRYHAGRIAARLGGGGHPAAAGVTLKMPLEEAKLAIVQAIVAEEEMAASDMVVPGDHS